MVGPDELRAMGERSIRDSVGLLAVIWVEIAVLLTAVNLLPRLSLAWSVPLGAILLVLLSTRINALGVVVHEGSHGFLARSRRLNDRLCNLGAAYWTLNSVEQYRPTHRLHHRYLGDERDPDRTAYVWPDRPGELARLVVLDLLGITALRRALTVAAEARKEGEGNSQPFRRGVLAGMFVAELVILAQFLLVQGLWRGIWFYLVFWLVPTICVFPLILRFKNIAEHFDPGLQKRGVPMWVARTSVASAIQNHLLGARMEYHFEHHVLPTIPYRGLRALHGRLEGAGLFAQNEELLSGGYVRFAAHLPGMEAAASPLSDLDPSPPVVSEEPRASA